MDIASGRRENMIWDSLVADLEGPVDLRLLRQERLLKTYSFAYNHEAASRPRKFFGIDYSPHRRDEEEEQRTPVPGEA